MGMGSGMDVDIRCLSLETVPGTYLGTEEQKGRQELLATDESMSLPE